MTYLIQRMLHLPNSNDSLNDQETFVTGSRVHIGADKSNLIQKIQRISIGRPQICWRPQFNGKTNNIGQPTS